MEREKDSRNAERKRKEKRRIEREHEMGKVLKEEERRIKLSFPFYSPMIFLGRGLCSLFFSLFLSLSLSLSSHSLSLSFSPSIFNEAKKDEIWKSVL